MIVLKNKNLKSEKMPYNHKKEVFEVLKESGICHAIGVSVQVMRLKTIHAYSKQWFVIISQMDKRKVKGFKNSEGRDDTAEKNLTPSEIATFKKMQAEYIKVLHSADGRIYEQKDNPLSKRINNK